MLTPLLAGFVLGLSAGIAPGPLMALVIAQTLAYGTKEGMKVAIAPIATDVPIVVFALLLLSWAAGFKWVIAGVGAIGGLYVFYLGFESLKSRPVSVNASDTKADSIKKGALVNFLNPHPYLFWITVGGPLIIKFKNEAWYGAVLFIVGFYLLLVGGKLVLAFLVGKSRKLLQGRIYLYLMRLLGLALMVFAVILLKDAFYLVR